MNKWTKILTIFMAAHKKFRRKILQCQEVLRYQERKLILNPMRKNKYLRKRKTKNKAMDISIIQYPRLYQNKKNHSRNNIYNK
jgi:hypothetical protein